MNFGKIKRSFRSFICLFIYSRSLRHIVRDGYLFQYIKNFFTIRNDIRSENTLKFRYQISICACTKNEAPYIKEWIEFHKLVGVEHFYIYDNNSTDNTREVLDSYIKDGIVTYIKYSGRAKQVPAYNDAIKNFKSETKWMGFFDLDEFITPIITKTVSDFLTDFESYPGLALDWVFYGDNYQTHIKKGLVIERFTKHQNITDKNQIVFGKVIVNPRCVSLIFVHLAYFRNNATSVNPNHEPLPFHYSPVGADPH